MNQITRAALRSYFPKDPWGRGVQPLPELGCVYVKNAKAGSSTVLLWLYRIHTGDHEFVPAGTPFKDKLPTTRDVGRGRVARMLGGDAFRFTFVREPIGRVESAYVSKIVRAADGRLGRRVELQRTLGLPEDREQVPTFDQFVAALESTEPIRMDQHWRPQHLNLMHPLVEYDVVGRLENFDADLARIREMTGLPDVGVRVLNRSRPKSDSLFDGRPDLLRRVRDVYARDFELYGY